MLTNEELNTVPTTNSIEAVLFASGEPLCISETAKTLAVSKKQIVTLLRRLQAEYDDSNRGMRINIFGDHAQMITRESYADFVKLLTTPKVNQPLRQAVLETLAVIAYHQPATRAEIDQIRGVKSDSSVKTLLDMELIRELGKRDTLGRPMEFGTTDKFLSHFGIAGLSDLPIPGDGANRLPAEQITFLTT
ncbi:MAG: SMC-Scp complex subunit ScpB [Oscillospiraceae bacterium]|jgi:segregation and condensation protein B|nr:SMC-Scp complex subunit ScpB [Oscillospiraceae bacterium]